MLLSLFFARHMPYALLIHDAYADICRHADDADTLATPDAASLMLTRRHGAMIDITPYCCFTLMLRITPPCFATAPLLMLPLFRARDFRGCCCA